MLIVSLLFIPYSFQYFLSKLRYCIASAKCFWDISVCASKSAIVLATFNILPYALGLNPNFLNAFSKIILEALFNLQNFSMSFGVNPAFE